MQKLLYLCTRNKHLDFMKKHLFYSLITCTLILAACNQPSRIDQYKAKKHTQDSIRLEEQIRSLAYYEAQLEQLMPVADSLLPLFTYEKNAKYQDHGYYVASGRNGLRVKVRDDGKQPVLIYQNGKRIEATDDPVMDRAQHLVVTISDIKELEKRIARTSLEIQKYQKRLQNNQIFAK